MNCGFAFWALVSVFFADFLLERLLSRGSFRGNSDLSWGGVVIIMAFAPVSGDRDVRRLGNSYWRCFKCSQTIEHDFVEWAWEIRCA